MLILIMFYSPGRNCRGGRVNFRIFDFLPSFKFMQILGKFELFRQTFPPTPLYYDPNLDPEVLMMKY